MKGVKRSNGIIRKETSSYIWKWSDCGKADEQGTKEQSTTSTEQDGTTEGEDANSDYQLANSLLAIRDQIDQALTLLKWRVWSCKTKNSVSNIRNKMTLSASS
jgi:hypothetical protein